MNSSSPIQTSPQNKNDYSRFRVHVEENRDGDEHVWITDDYDKSEVKIQDQFNFGTCAIHCGSNMNTPKSKKTIDKSPSINHYQTDSSQPPQHSSPEHTDLDRPLSPIDPMSDRVSTILVWQHLTVQIREDKRKEFFQRMKSYKHFTPKRKSLLNNISGAITGGLWAVMGNFHRRFLSV